MPKAPRTAEAVEAAREHILEEASALILDEGFDRFSMRKLGRRLGMTAANIYHYYHSKDDLYLAIQTRGFELLRADFERVAAQNTTPTTCLKNLMQAYVDFGLAHPDFYEIIFSRNTPKYIDYVGTDTEPVARYEKEAGLRIGQLTAGIITEIARANHLELNPFHEMLRLWTGLHGIVALINTRVLQEVDVDWQQDLPCLLEALFRPLEAKQE